MSESVVGVIFASQSFLLILTIIMWRSAVTDMKYWKGQSDKYFDRWVDLLADYEAEKIVEEAEEVSDGEGECGGESDDDEDNWWKKGKKED